MFERLSGDFTSRGTRTRTQDTRFWSQCQMSKISQCLSDSSSARTCKYRSDYTICTVKLRRPAGENAPPLPVKLRHLAGEESHSNRQLRTSVLSRRDFSTALAARSAGLACGKVSAGMAIVPSQPGGTLIMPEGERHCDSPSGSAFLGCSGQKSFQNLMAEMKSKG